MNQNNINTFNDRLINNKNISYFALVQNKIENNYNRYELKEGNIIKLGNVYLKIKKLNIKNKNNKNKTNKSFLKLSNINKNNSNINETNNITTTDNLKKNNKEKNLKKILELNISDKESKREGLNMKRNLKYINQMKTKLDKTCRICYTEETDEDNPLIHPCSCIGSMKYIHFKCLKFWLEENTFILEENYQFFQKYKYREPKCELCHSKFPEIIYYRGKEYHFFDKNNQFNGFNKYVIFELLSSEDNKYKILYVLSLDKKILQIGRANDNELIIQDTSISRNHSILRLINNNLLLEDSNSKYGTLILIHTPFFQLEDNVNLFLQIRNNFIKCKMYNSSKPSFFSCCAIDNQDIIFDYYYKQNKINEEEKNKLNIVEKYNSDSEEESLKEKKSIKSEIINENKRNFERTKKDSISNFTTNVNALTPLNNIKMIPELEDEN